MPIPFATASPTRPPLRFASQHLLPTMHQSPGRPPGRAYCSCSRTSGSPTLPSSPVHTAPRKAPPLLPTLRRTKHVSLESSPPLRRLPPTLELTIHPGLVSLKDNRLFGTTNRATSFRFACLRRSSQAPAKSGTSYTVARIRSILEMEIQGSETRFQILKNASRR